MDKAIIFGIYNFVSFHACKILLESGIEVKGVHLDVEDQGPYLDEKRLEVGRNANFCEQSFSEWVNSREKDTTETTFIFSIYDIYMLKKESVLKKENVTKAMLQYIERNKNKLDFVFILPIQLLRADQDPTIGTFLDQVKEYGGNNQFLYLPAIYGPWQPSTFLFQQAILSKFQNSEIIKGEREWSGDALFVEDAIDTIIKTIETRKPGKFVLESGKKNFWAQCAAYLQIDEGIANASRHDSLQISDEINRVSVNKVTSIADSIIQQVDHVQRLFSNGLK